MTSPPIHTPEKSERELRQVSGPKRQLLEVAQQLQYVDRVPLYGVDCRVFGRYDDSMFVSIDPDSEFRAVWEVITELMGLVAPVDTREDVGVDDVDDVRFVALAAGTRRSLRVELHADGSLRVKASWAASSDASMAQVLMDQTYTLD